MAKWWFEDSLDICNVYSRHGAIPPSQTGDFECQQYPAPFRRYYVRVCGFTFSFGSLDQMKEYLAYYQQKLITPNRGVAGDHWESQSRFQELPRYLHDEKRRPRVVAALERALADFEKQEQS